MHARIFICVDLESQVDALLAAMFVRRKCGACAIAAKEDVGACLAVPHHFEHVRVKVRQAYLDNAITRARIYFEHARVRILLFPLGKIKDHE